MLEAFDRERRKVAILQNAFGISESQRINALDTLQFSLPQSDAKADYCQPFCYVRWRGGELYRILPKAEEWGENGTLTFDCEHVLGTLMDDLLPDFHQVGNLGVYTDQVIRYVLDRQKTKRWVLDGCDFKRQYEYGWEDENLLSALFSIPKPFTEKYIWKTDTTAYPWRLSLKRLDESARPQLYIRAGKNMLSLRRTSDPKNICTRIYPKGYGEGVNQLTIQEVNGGVPYLQSPKEYTDQYGIIERVWIDRRYENPQSLKEAAQAMLEGLQQPYLEYEVEFAQLGNNALDQAEVGKIAEIITPAQRHKTYVVGIDWDYGDMTQSKLVIANRPQDIASSIADLADRQRIEQTYAQGATQLYNYSLQVNADAQNGAVVDFFVPSEMRVVNALRCKIRMDRFRSYSKATEDGGRSTQTSSSGGGSRQTSSSGGGSRQTSSSGGGTSKSTAADGGVSKSTQSGGGTQTTSGPSSTRTTNGGGGGTSGDGGYLNFDRDTGYSPVPEGMGTHKHDMILNIPSHAHSIPSHSHGMDHTHTVAIPDHVHEFSVPNHVHEFEIRDHAHTVEVPAHTHTVNIPDHTHKVDIPTHRHDIVPGIYFFGGANRFDIYVNGTKRGSYEGTTAELDITKFLLGSDGKISRGSYQTLEVRPNGLAYISVTLTVQGFVQSRGDMTV